MMLNSGRAAAAVAALGDMWILFYRVNGQLTACGNDADDFDGTGIRVEGARIRYIK